MITTARQLKDLVRNLSKKKSADAQILMRNYMMERFLERSCTVTICRIRKPYDEAWLLSVYGGCRTHRFYEYGKHHNHEYYDKKAGIWCITGCGYDK